MKKNVFKTALVLFLGMICSVSVLVAQQTAGVYEMRLVNNGSPNIEFQMRCINAANPCPTTSDAILDITYIIRWDNSYGINLGTPMGDYGISKSSVETVQGIYEYQIYQISVAPWFFPVNWTANTWYTMATMAVSQTGTGTGTFEIAPTGFNVQGNPNFNVSGSDYLPAIVGSATNVPLPVELVAFSGKIKDCSSVQLKWTTATEQDNACFEIEHSTNATKWEVVDKVAGQGTSVDVTNYSYSHAPKEKGLHYYRLRQVDLDAAFQYSNILSFNFNCEGYKFFPNPVTHTLTIDGPLSATSTYTIFDATGATMVSGGGTNPQIDVSFLPSGIYYVELMVEGSVIRHKMVKQ